jgi:hypothetical protein
MERDDADDARLRTDGLRQLDFPKGSPSAVAHRLVRFVGLHFTAPTARWLAPASDRNLAAAGLLP